MLKASQQPGQPEEIPRKSSGIDPPGDGACVIAEWLASGQRAAILSDIIMNKNLKLFANKLFVLKSGCSV